MLRKKATCRAPGTARSSVNMPCPVNRRRSSTRLIRDPIFLGLTSICSTSVTAMPGSDDNEVINERMPGLQCLLNKLAAFDDSSEVSAVALKQAKIPIRIAVDDQ